MGETVNGIVGGRWFEKIPAGAAGRRCVYFYVSTATGTAQNKRYAHRAGGKENEHHDE